MWGVSDMNNVRGGGRGGWWGTGARGVVRGWGCVYISDLRMEMLVVH